MILSVRRALIAARVALSISLVATAAYFLAFRRGWLAPSDTAVLLLAATTCVLLTVELGRAVVDLARRRRHLFGFASTTAFTIGLLVVFAAGWAHWALRLRGWVILNEGDTAPFFHGAHLQEFDAGPLSNPKEMDVVLYLDRVRVRKVPDGGYQAVSSLRLLHHAGSMAAFRLSPNEVFADGTLRFFQGAFGYSPRIVILHEQETLFDKAVPFTTRRDDAGQFVFQGAFNVAAHGLEVTGEVALDTMDDDLRGHPRLVLTVNRDGKSLGTGSLRMGFFADLEDGHRVGFAGLKKWVEIDIIRVTYTDWLTRGAWIASFGLLGLIAQFLTRWWRRR